jgi:exodeoxyribonuclease VII small subunit
MNDTVTKEPAEDDLGFEEAIKRLDELVESMESGSAPLSELVDRYEEGAKLLKICRKRLELAELKIKEVREKDDQMVAEPMGQDTNE